MTLTAIRVEFESDVRALMDIRNHVREFMTGSQKEIDWRAQREWWSELDHDNVKIWLYLDEDEFFIGYGQLRIEPEGPRYGVTSHALIESARGKGYGEEILRDLVERARNFGCDAMRAEIFKSNEASLGLCKKLGYTVTKDLGDIVEVQLPL